MSQTEPTWQTQVFGILPHPSEPHLLMRSDEKAYTLPSFLLQKRGKWIEDGLVKREMQQTLGCQLNLLYRAYYTENAAQYRAESIYVLESKEAAASEGHWVSREQLADLPLAWPAHRPVIEKHLSEAEGGPIPKQRSPWARPGWYAAAAVWIEGQLNQLGHELAGPLEMVRSWSLSCVLQAQTVSGMAFFFKAGVEIPLFINEAAVLPQLAVRYPNHIPMPLQADPEQRWMLLADFGEQPPYEQATPAQQEAMLYTFGQLQIEATAHGDELLALGLLDRRLDRLATQIEPLFNDAEATAALTESELEQLHSLAPQLKRRCEQLAHYPIPQTLVHGDLHTGNVVFPNGRPLFFDWTDACISHPFFDVMLHISHLEDTGLQEHLRDRYLSLWTDFAPMAQLKEIWAFALPLFAVHHAVSYQQIVAQVEDIAKHELSSATPDLLRKILKYIESNPT